MNVGRALGRVLREHGVRYAMGHPGGEVVELIEGLRTEGIEFVLTRHEATAAFMADAMGFYSGVPGVCVATLGPGATNLVTGVAHAHLDRAPVIALTGQLASDRYDIVTHQKLDLKALFTPISKWHAQVGQHNAVAVATRAVRVALAPRPGPVVLEVASDVAGASFTGPTVNHRRELSMATSFPATAFDAAARLLRESRRPVILAGLDAMTPDVPHPLRTLADTWGIPVVVSPKAKGVIPEDHDRFLGTIEMLGTARLFEFIGQCDLVVMIGMDPVEFDRDWDFSADVLHIGPMPNDDLYFEAAVELVGDVASAIEGLLRRAGEATEKWPVEEQRDLRDSFVNYINPEIGGVSAQQVLSELRRVLPRDALVTCDVGQNKSVTGQCWPTYEPKTFFMSNGLSSMGYGLPSALALQLLEPNRRVACILGDGGFGMYLGELETAVRHELPVTIVILADQALTQIKMNQNRRGFPATGTEFGRIDYAGLARSLGADGVEVASLTECREALTWATQASGPTVVAVQIDPDCYKL